MFCPVCSQEQISEQTRFCSRCGFLLTGVSQLIANGGASLLPPRPAATNIDPNAISPRKKGLKRGTLLIFSSFIVVPLLAIITVALSAEPYLVAAAAVLLGGGGILRLIYALLFESGTPGAVSESVLPQTVQNVLPSAKQPSQALPAQQSIPVSGYAPPPPAAGNWRDTNDLAAAPPSVTEPTTKLLAKEE